MNQGLPRRTAEHNGQVANAVRFPVVSHVGTAGLQRLHAYRQLRTARV